MIFSVASGLTYVNNRRVLSGFFPESLKDVWNEWELRGLILLSLTLQIVLIMLGKRRKYIAKIWIRFTLWSAYLMADWVATVALGVISNDSRRGDCSTGTNPPPADDDHPKAGVGVDKGLMSFWAAFLLLHLGGPDTITAYALEDNELWLRHLLGLVVQTGVAAYIFFMAWPAGHTWLSLLTIPMFLAGLIKYGERTWALRSANSEHLRESMLTRPDPGPNYAKFMEEYTLKKAEGFHVKADEVIEASVPIDLTHSARGERELVLKAYSLFKTFKRLFVDLILSFQHRETSQGLFKDMDAKKTFGVIEVELGFAFDVFYTKAPVIYTLRGGFLRLVSFSSTFSVLVAFVLVIESDKYHKIDLIITCF